MWHGYITEVCSVTIIYNSCDMDMFYHSHLLLLHSHTQRHTTQYNWKTFPHCYVYKKHTFIYLYELKRREMKKMEIIFWIQTTTTTQSECASCCSGKEDMHRRKIVIGSVPGSDWGNARHFDKLINNKEWPNACWPFPWGLEKTFFVHSYSLMEFFVGDLMTTPTVEVLITFVGTSHSPLKSQVPSAPPIWTGTGPVCSALACTYIIRCMVIGLVERFDSTACVVDSRRLRIRMSLSSDVILCSVHLADIEIIYEYCFDINLTTSTSSQQTSR